MMLNSSHYYLPICHVWLCFHTSLSKELTLYAEWTRRSYKLALGGKKHDSIYALVISLGFSWENSEISSLLIWLMRERIARKREFSVSKAFNARSDKTFYQNSLTSRNLNQKPSDCHNINPQLFQWFIAWWIISHFLLLCCQQCPSVENLWSREFKLSRVLQQWIILKKL